MALGDNSRSTSFRKATLEIEGEGAPLECWFNPTQYSIAKSNTWKAKPAVGGSVPPTQFGGGNPRQLTLELLFDAEPDGDVSSTTNRLLKMMEVDSDLDNGKAKLGRPPTVTLAWGTFLSFRAVCSSLTVQYTMFRPDGTPTRATTNLTLMQVEQDPVSGSGTPAGTNPTTRVDRRLRSHVVVGGESLQSIAYKHYGDAGSWRRIAEHNGIDDPVIVPRGRTLAIPLDTL
jgi:hypothetical protein